MTTKDTTVRGGKREGSGRKPWSPFQEKTKAIRIPESQEPIIRDFLEAFKRKQLSSQLNNVQSIEQPAINPPTIDIPLYSNRVPAGLPSAVDDHVDKRLDLNEYMIREADATFFVRIRGDSMIDAGIFDNDVVIVDKSLVASMGDIVLASVDGEFTVKTLGKTKELTPRLLPANSKFSPIEIKEGMDFDVWGVVTGSLRKFK
jgi:DNA polymerase V